MFIFRQKIDFIPYLFLENIANDIAKLFWVLLACLVKQFKMLVQTCKKTLMLICKKKKQLHHSLLSEESIKTVLTQLSKFALALGNC